MRPTVIDESPDWSPIKENCKNTRVGIIGLKQPVDVLINVFRKDHK